MKESILTRFNMALNSSLLLRITIALLMATTISTVMVLITDYLLGFKMNDLEIVGLYLVATVVAVPAMWNGGSGKIH